MSNKIKRPMNAYMLFNKEKRAEIIQQKPELKSKVAEVAKLIGNYWKEMTIEEKAKYVKMVEENKKDMKVKFKNKSIAKFWIINLYVYLVLYLYSTITVVLVERQYRKVHLL